MDSRSFEQAACHADGYHFFLASTAWTDKAVWLQPSARLSLLATAALSTRPCIPSISCSYKLFLTEGSWLMPCSSSPSQPVYRPADTLPGCAQQGWYPPGPGQSGGTVPPATSHSPSSAGLPGAPGPAISKGCCSACANSPSHPPRCLRM